MTLVPRPCDFPSCNRKSRGPGNEASVHTHICICACKNAIIKYTINTKRNDFTTQLSLVLRYTLPERVGQRTSYIEMSAGHTANPPRTIRTPPDDGRTYLDVHVRDHVVSGILRVLHHLIQQYRAHLRERQRDHGQLVNCN